jgi:hypothetical protein
MDLITSQHLWRPNTTKACLHLEAPEVGIFPAIWNMRRATDPFAVRRSPDGHGIDAVALPKCSPLPAAAADQAESCIASGRKPTIVMVLNQGKAWSNGRPRKAFICSSGHWQMRLSSDLEMRLAPPRASTRASSLRVEMPPVGEEAAPGPLGDSQGEITNVDGEQALAVAIAKDGAPIGVTLMMLGPGQGKNLSLQQVLEPSAHILGDQGASGGALHELGQLGGATMGEGHGLYSVS